MKPLLYLSFTALVAFPVIGQQRQSEGDGSKLFGDRCLACHGNARVEAAPPPAMIKKMTPERIYQALTTGSMKVNAADMTDQQKREIAEFMGGRRMGATESGDAKNMSNRCPSNAAVPDLASVPAWNGWGVDLSNTRFQPAKSADLSVGQVSRLKLKWAFGLPGAISVYGQPTIVAGRVFVSSDTGIVYSLDADSGCVHWSFQAQSGVRSAITVGKAGATKNAAFFGDIHGNAYAVDMTNGELLWKSQVESHPLARITGAPKLHANRLYVPVASLEEPESAGLKYPCCTFRGSMVALNAETGKQIWKTYTVTEAPTMRKTPAGVAFQGPSGGGVWDSPTIDLKRKALYIGTGNNFSEPATKTSDAVMAMDMDTGRILWTYQERENDVWHTGCPSVRFGIPPNVPARGGPGAGRGAPPPRPADYYCPEAQNPDWDVSVSPILTTLPDGRSAVIVGQKSGVVWAHDVDKKGAVIWKSDVARIVPGGGGEIVFGGAVDNQNAYFNLRSGGIVALELSTGMEKWYRALPPQESMATHPGLSSAVTVIPGVVFSGGLDGMLRAFAAGDGNLIWSFNTAREFEAVNGMKVSGGSIGAPGPTIAQGMVLVGSGYTGFQGGAPGNVLLAFVPYDKIPAFPGAPVRRD